MLGRFHLNRVWLYFITDIPVFRRSYQTIATWIVPFSKNSPIRSLTSIQNIPKPLSTAIENGVMTWWILKFIIKSMEKQPHYSKNLSKQIFEELYTQWSKGEISFGWSALGWGP